jgi:hypothetical protein
MADYKELVSRLEMSGLKYIGVYKELIEKNKSIDTPTKLMNALKIEIKLTGERHKKLYEPSRVHNIPLRHIEDRKRVRTIEKMNRSIEEKNSLNRGLQLLNALAELTQHYRKSSFVFSGPGRLV